MAQEYLSGGDWKKHAEELWQTETEMQELRGQRPAQGGR
jgi:hypothetical protein